MMNHFDWTDDRKARLTELWAEGMPCLKIAAVIGCSKNSVISKARRLGLSRRPSPVLGRWPGVSYRQARSRAPFEPLGPSAPKVASAPKPPRPRATPPPTPAPVAPKPPALSLGAYTAPRSCQWPFGEPGRPGFRFCGAETAFPHPYCPEHCRVAYVPRSVALGVTAP